jgi:hypothetical protein
MAPLPISRIDICAPFEATSMDVFGPFHVIHGGRATTKRWVLLLTCMACRAIHFEALKDMSMMYMHVHASTQWHNSRPGDLD